MLSEDIEWVRLVFSIIIILGLAYIFSRSFTNFALSMTTQGGMWVRLLGPKWGRAGGALRVLLGSIGVGTASERKRWRRPVRVPS